MTTTPFIEVVSDAQCHQLLGHLMGVDGSHYDDRHDWLELEERAVDEDGVFDPDVMIRVSYRLIKRACRNDTWQNRRPDAAPSYADRQILVNLDQVQWSWRAIAVSFDQYEQMFDIDEFVPIDNGEREPAAPFSGEVGTLPGSVWDKLKRIGTQKPSPSEFTQVWIDEEKTVQKVAADFGALDVSRDLDLQVMLKEKTDAAIRKMWRIDGSVDPIPTADELHNQFSKPLAAAELKGVRRPYTQREVEAYAYGRPVKHWER